MKVQNMHLRQFWDFDFSDWDDYGFLRDREYNNELYQSFKSNYVKVLAIRLQKWAGLLIRQNPVEKSKKVKKYVRQGIPFAFRGSVWLTVSGAEDLKNAMPDNFYNSLLQEEHSRAMRAMIALDIHRTYPDNIFFRGSSRLQIKLCNVLTAYSHHNATLGYCQGFNYIAGMLILATKCEEKAFWLLKVLVEDILKDYYSTTMEGVMVDIKVLSELIRMKLPDVHEHMSNLGLPWALVTTKWFVCVYADLLPAETVFRIWDCLFYEGSKIIFRVGITLIKNYRRELLACKNLTEAVDCFRKMTRNKFTLNCHEFMQSIFQEPGHLSKSTIQELREKIHNENDQRKKQAAAKTQRRRKDKKKAPRKN